MMQKKSLKVAFLIPSLEQGPYWEPLVNAVAKEVQEVKLFTSQLWPGFRKNAFIELIGRKNYWRTNKGGGGYDRGFMLLSPVIVGALWKMKPTTVYCQAFSLWTFWAVCMKPFLGYKTILLYEGSSANVDFRDSTLRKIWRKSLSRGFDFFISNTRSGTEYLKDYLGVDSKCLSQSVYLVPDRALLDEAMKLPAPRKTESGKIVFLSVGQLIERKNTDILIDACKALNQEHKNTFELWVVGDGALYGEFQDRVNKELLCDVIYCFGRVEYSDLGAFYKNAHVFIFPTLEDTWGMVVSEAMMSGLPVICSVSAGAVELVQNNQSGFCFKPTDAGELKKLMEKFILDASLVKRMGEKSSDVMNLYSVQRTKDELLKVASL